VRRHRDGWRRQPRAPRPRLRRGSAAGARVRARAGDARPHEPGALRPARLTSVVPARDGGRSPRGRPPSARPSTRRDRKAAFRTGMVLSALTPLSPQCRGDVRMTSNGFMSRRPATRTATSSRLRRIALAAMTAAGLALGGTAAAAAAPAPAGSGPAPAAPALAAPALAAEDLALPAAEADDDGWFTSWAQSQQRVSTKNFDNQSLRMVTRLSQGGDAVRIRLQNQFGTGPVVIDQTNLALSAGGPAIVPGTDRVLTFDGA